MKIKLNLSALTIIKAVDEPIVCPDTLSLICDSNTYGNMSLVITAKNGKKENKFKCTMGTAIDLSFLLYGGLLEITIDGIVKGEIVKSWEIVPIIIKEHEAHFEFSDIIKDLTERIALLEEKTKSRF